jgi:hypothetical protein
MQATMREWDGDIKVVVEEEADMTVVKDEMI